MLRGGEHAGARGGVRVLHVISFFHPDFTGEGIYLEKLARDLARHEIGSDVAVAETWRTAPVAPAFETVIYFGDRAGPKLYFNRRMFMWFLKNVRRYDVVHFHSWTDRVMLFHLVTFLAGRPIIQSATLVDGLGMIVAGYRPKFRPLVRFLMKTITRAVAISRPLFDDHLNVLPRSRVHLIPQGVQMPATGDSQCVGNWRRRQGFTMDNVVALYVGGLCARKDVLFLIERHREMAGRYPALRLVIVGPPLEDDYATEVRRLAAAAGPSIQVLDFMPDPTEAYRAADVFVFASRAEGFGNVLIEAMSHGLPVICRRLPGVTDEIIEHGRTGYLFDDQAEYDLALTTLAGDDGLRRRFGDVGRQVALQKFSMMEVAGQYATLYRELATSR